jgi:hypothetical protein
MQTLHSPMIPTSGDKRQPSQAATFSGGATSWEYTKTFFNVPPGKSMIGITLYAMYRDDALPGAAYFDGISLDVI